MSIADGLNQFRGAFREELGTLRAGLSDQDVGGGTGLERLGATAGAGMGDYLGARLGAFGGGQPGAFGEPATAGWDSTGLGRLGMFGDVAGAGTTDRFAMREQINADAADRAARNSAMAAAKSGNAVEAGGDWSGPATADDNATLTPEKIDAWIASERPNSPLRGKGQFILQTANAHGVSAPLLLGIFLQESELGTTAGPGYNIAGVGGEGNFAQYGSWEQAIDGAAANLGTATYRGKSAAEQVGNWFAGPQKWAQSGLDATDSTGGHNGTVRDYLDKSVAAAYSGLGVPFNQAAGGRPRGGAGTGVPLGAGVPQSAYLDRTRTLVGRVGYTSGGVRSTGNIADGADCSSFAGWLIGADPVDWNAQRLYDVSAPVDPGQLRPGDLVFFNIANPGDATARPVGHVAVWLGNGKVAQSTTMNGTNGVQVVDLANDDWLRTHIYSYGRYARAQPQQGNY